jgi:hypothetical protein
MVWSMPGIINTMFGLCFSNAFNNMFDQKTGSRATAVRAMLFILFFGTVNPSYCQDLDFDPKGYADQWNISLTPFLLVPNISGEVQSEKLSEEFGIGPSDFIETLNGTFMLDAEVSKGKFFSSPAYIYTYNEVETVIWESENTNQKITAYPEMKKQIVELLGGMRWRADEKFMIDPYAGFRYTNYHIFGSVNGITGVSELDEHAGFFDPVIGVQTHFYPHPRIPIEVKADIGGFGLGSEFTWTALLHSGYVLSPSVDILVGFAALENQYETEMAAGNTYGMSSLTYGFDFGVRVYITGRFADSDVFKKKGKME